jgi:heat shock protein HslJ
MTWSSLIVRGCMMTFIALAGCNSSSSKATPGTQPAETAQKPDAAAALTDVTWTLKTINGEPALPREGRRQASIMFETRHHTIAANTGVNGMGGEYTLNGASLTIKPGMMTMMAGPPPMMKQEQAFVAALGKVTAHRIKDRTLDLLAGDQVIMTFEAGAE